MEFQQSSRNMAFEVLEKENNKHVIYGCRANGRDVEGEMVGFKTDDDYVAYIDKMQKDIEGLEMVLAVHAKDE